MAKINLLTSAEREGEILSASYRVPDNVEKVCEFLPELLQKDLLDPTISFSLDVYLSDDGKEWRHRAGMTNIGNSDKWDEPPSLGIPSKDLKGKYVQVRIEPDKKIEIGLSFEDKASVLSVEL